MNGWGFYQGIGGDGVPGAGRYHEIELKQMRQNREVIKSSVKTSGEVSQKDREAYYSSWYYAALRIMTSVPALRQASVMAERLGLPLDVVRQALAVLTQAGLIKQVESGYDITEKRLHIGRDTAHLTRHHTNWRLRSIIDAKLQRDESLHFSSVLRYALFVHLRLVA